ncbi:MAG: hypothetical protein ACE5GW_12920, partial [Planctomycetota bacterium]
VSGSKMRVQYELEDLGGRTRLDYACSFEATSLWMKLLSPVFKIMGRMMVRGFFKRLKSLAEAPQVDAAGASS